MICKDIITSTANGNIKRLSNLLKKTKLRHEEGVYVIEGKKMFLEFLDNEPEMIETVFATKEFIEKLDEDRLNALKTTTCLEGDG